MNEEMQQKNYLKWRKMEQISSIVALVAMVVGIIFIIIDIIPIAIIMAIVLAIMIGLNKISDGQLEKYCKECYKLLLGCAYQAKVVNQTSKHIQSTKESKYTLSYHITIVCPNCGKTQSIKKTFESNNSFSDCEIKMNNYCAKKFGH